MTKTLATTQHFDGSLTDDQIDLIKRTICQGATDDELQLFIGQCRRTRLDPFARQIYSIERSVKVGDKWEKKRSIQVSIDGFRLIAERTGGYLGQTAPLWCGSDGQWVDVWLAKAQPAAAKIGVHRENFKEPVWGVATFDSYAQRNAKGELTSMWAKMGDVMIAKCAEALALRKAFPQELSGLYTTDEMGQADNSPKLAEKTLEETVREAGGTVTEIAPKDEPAKDWREVVCHVGKADGPMLGKKLRELNPHLIKWLAETWMPSRKATEKDRKLADAVEAAVKEGADKSPESPVEPSGPETPADTPPAEEKPAGEAPVSRAKASKAEAKPAPAKKMEWRSVVNTIGKVYAGKTLGEIAASKPNEFGPDSDAPRILKSLCRKGIPMIENSEDVKDRILVNAIKAACEETGALLDEGGLRAELLLRLSKAKIKPDDANAKLVEIEVFNEGETIQKASEAMLRFIFGKWAEVEAKLTE